MIGGGGGSNWVLYFRSPLMHPLACLSDIKIYESSYADLLYHTLLPSSFTPKFQTRAFYVENNYWLTSQISVMPESQHLFTLPIAFTQNPEKEPDGTIVCTQTPSENGPIYLLTMTYYPDNRLTTPLLQSLLLALDILEHAYPHGVVVTTSGIPKFYSNGLDLDHLRDTPNFFSQCLFVVFRRFLT